jgi:hypothetical protein
MAKIVEKTITIKFSKIVKDDVNDALLIPADVDQALEQVAQELVGDGIVVEIE